MFCIFLSYLNLMTIWQKPAELEKEDGPPLETITQNLSREGSVVLSQTPLAQDMTEVLDAGGTPPPVIVMSEDDTTDNIGM